MSLIKCKECGKEISDKAKTCVHCGTPLQKEEKNVCPECGKIMKDNKCSNCGKEIDNIKIITNETENNNSNPNNGRTSGSLMIIIMPIIVGLLIWGAINYFITGDIFGAFGGKGKIVDTSWRTSYGDLTFFKGGKCELINILPSDTCTWKLDGKDVTIKYSVGSVKGTINGKFNENYSRLTITGGK